MVDWSSGYCCSPAVNEVRRKTDDKVEVMGINENLARVQARIREAASRSGRDESEIRLLGVTKSAADGEVRELIEAGLLLLGENRVQNARKRIEAFPEAEWHLIGTLQTNKVRYCESFALIHSLDRWSAGGWYPKPGGPNPRYGCPGCARHPPADVPIAVPYPIYV
jgi:hypothetical protein